MATPPGYASELALPPDIGGVPPFAIDPGGAPITPAQEMDGVIALVANATTELINGEPVDPLASFPSYFYHDGIRTFLEFFCKAMSAYPQVRPALVALNVFDPIPLAAIDAVVAIGISACALNKDGPN